MQARGFTIIEMVIVIVVLGILSATTLPRYIDSSNNARRAINKSTVAALNESMAGVLSRVQVTGALLTANSVSATYSTWPHPIVVNIDNNSRLASNGYIGFWSSTGFFPFGAGTAPYSTAPDFGTNYADLVYADPPTQGCTNLFNVLLSNASVQTSSSSTSTYITLTAATNAMGTINGMPAGTFYASPVSLTPLSTSFAPNGTTPPTSPTLPVTNYIVTPAQLGVVGTGNPPAGNGACVYQMNNTKSTIFYILYDPIKIMFYTGEYQP